jgi:hypothetical protein
MNAFATLLPALCTLLPAAVQREADLQFDGERYVKKDVFYSAEIRREEYVRPHETLENWTKLVAVRNFTTLDDPKQAVVEFSERLKRQDPPVESRMLVAKDGSEAVIDFVTGPKDGSYGEYNVWRYMKVKGYTGLIAYQFAYRMASDKEIETFTKSMIRWAEELAKAKFELGFGK